MSNSQNIQVFLGIDWGTRSSKWACYVVGESQPYILGRILDSDLVRAGDSLIFAPDISEITEENVTRGLKGIIINDPLGQSFWQADRIDTGGSLGEAVAFSLCCILGESARGTVKDLKDIKSQRVEIGFSFPNWIGEQTRKYRVAARNFHEAVTVSVFLLNLCSWENLPKPGESYPIKNWKEIVNEARVRLEGREDPNLEIGNMTQKSYTLDGQNLSWIYLVESCAAGLPYLRAIETESVPGVPGLAKLLVIDVGAGSTDVGYMLRVVNRETSAENFYYFPPALSFREAGEVLTKEILLDYSARGEPMTYTQAEALKLQSTGWHELPFVTSWKRRICEHVKRYVEGITDNRWLPEPLTLNVVVTGGSGLVPGLKEDIKSAVCEVLERRQSAPMARKKVVLIGEHLPSLDFETEAEYARRAVSIGACDQGKPGFRYQPKMDPATPSRAFKRSNWV